MSASSAPLKKPIGPVIYEVTRGADMWPGIGRGTVRVSDGKPAVLQDYLANNAVAVDIMGQQRVMSRREWRALPIYKGLDDPALNT